MNTQKNSGIRHWWMRAPVLTAFVALLIVAPAWGKLKLDFEELPEPVEIPNIEGIDLVSGETVSLAGLAGHVVVIDIWATWCAPCVRELPELMEYQAEHAEESFTYVGLSIDTIQDTEMVKAFAEKKELNYPILMSNSEMLRVLGRAIGHGIQAVPTKIVVDRTGHIAFSVAGSPSITDEDNAEYLSRLEKLLEAPIPERDETALAN